MNRLNLKSFRILKLVKRWTQGHDCSGALNPASLIETSQQNKRIEWQARFSEFISGLFELAKALEILVYQRDFISLRNSSILHWRCKTERKM
jgi:hypothetical protein